MLYLKLKKFFDSLGIKSVNLNSSDMLKIVIENNRTDLYNAFKNQAFNLENILLIINKSSNINDILFLKRFNFNYSNNKKELIITLIDKGYYEMLVIFYDDLIKDSELLDIFIDNIENYNCDSILLGNVFNNTNKKEIIIRKLNESKRFDLVSFLIDKVNVDNNLFNVIKDNLKDIIEFINFYQMEIKTDCFKNNFKLFDEYFFNGYCNIINKVMYMGYENLRNYVNNNEQILKQYIEYIKEDKVNLDVIPYLSKFQNSSELLKIVIDKKYFDYIEKFDQSAWNLNLCLDVLKNGDFDISKLSKIPIFNYYINRNTSSYVYKARYNNLVDINNINEVSICYGIYSDIVDGKIEVDSNLMRLYKFLGECRSNDICKLTYALIDNDLNNVDKLINESGLTPFYLNFLKYDADYIKYKGDAILEEIDNPNYGAFIKMLQLDENMRNYLNPLFINQYNIDIYIKNNTLTHAAILKLYNNIEMEALGVLIENNYELELSELQKVIVVKCNNIKSQEQEKIFFEYCVKNQDITIEQVDRIYELIIRINHSNSYEIRKQADRFIKKLSKREDFLLVFDEVESLLTGGRIPEFLKRFVVFKILKDQDILSDPSVTSPILKSCKTEEEAEKIVLFDLFRTSLATNSNDILHYLDIIEKGEKLYQSIENINNLDEDSKILIHEYRIRLEFICDYLLKLDYEKDEDDLKTLYNIEKSFQNKLNIHFPFDFHIPFTHDLMLKEICPKYPSFILLRAYMGQHEVLATALEEGKRLRGEKLQLKKGDFIKGINSDYLDSIVENGSNCADLLGEDFHQDGTHMDTDMSRLTKDYSNIKELVSDRSLTATTWEDMIFIIPMENISFFNEYIITKDENGKKEFTEDDKYKTEIFNYSNSSNHYLIRSSFPLTYVSGIIASKNFDRARFIISKNKFYIPIYDQSGNLIYSREDYDKDRKKLAGLSFYGCSDYQISDNLMSEDIEEVVQTLIDDREVTNKKRQAIYDKLNSVFQKYFKGIKNRVSNSVEKGILEIIDTGSTGRGTNVPNDSDFDFIIRLDEEFIKSDQFEKFSSEIYELFHVPKGDNKVIRIKDAKVDGIDMPLQIELTVIGKNSKVIYSTDMCLQDRLLNIYKKYPDKFGLVKANIIFAKEFFKKIKRYKGYEKGFGGVGVENFVLQNGGSFLDAVKSFLEVAKLSQNLTEFKRKYHIYDYGKNHFSYEENNYKKVSFPYDDYVNNLDDKSYTEIVTAFEKFLQNNLEIDNKKLA